MKRSFLSATLAATIALIPFSIYAVSRAQDDGSTNSRSVQVNAIIEEAFSSQVVNGQRVRKELNHVVFWFANPADANECFAPADAPMTVFDGDGVAGPAAFSSQDTLPGAPLP